ncbi:hypothetical protein [Streptomyces sp. NPDC016845]|uniref:hypothetical protein n=1 Tax=Streptomyces sp. NPDC016845 TaxID=3364972 RepID=UPI0037BCFA26
MKRTVHSQAAEGPEKRPLDLETMRTTAHRLLGLADHYEGLRGGVPKASSVLGE